MGHIKIVVFGIFFVLSGCATATGPTLTPLEIQSLQTREYEHGIEVVFPSVISVFQDLGYTVKSADKDSGLITAESTSKSNVALKFWLGMSSVQKTAATAFVEKIGQITKVRLSFVAIKSTSSAYGQTDRNDDQILDAKIYGNAFERIESAIFVRSSN